MFAFSIKENIQMNTDKSYIGLFVFKITPTLLETLKFQICTLELYSAFKC